MDPLSIASGSAGLATLCIKISALLYEYIEDTRNVDENVSSLCEEIKGLSRVLDAVSRALKQNHLIPIAEADDSLWGTLRASLDDCKETLSKLNRVVAQVQQTSSVFGGIFRKPVKQLRFSLKGTEIAAFRQRVQAANSAMQTALQWINVCLALSGNVSQAVIMRELTMLKDMVAAAMNTAFHQNQNPLKTPYDTFEDSRRISRNLHHLARAAESYHSSASTVIAGASRSTVIAGRSTVIAGGSIFGEPLSAEQYQHIESWIPPAIPEDNTEGSSTLVGDPGNTIKAQQSDSESDIESDLLDKLEELATASLSEKDYAKAEPFLCRLISQKQRNRYHLETVSIWKVKLAFAYCFQSKWREAEAVLVSMVDSMAKVEVPVLHCFHALAAAALETRDQNHAYELGKRCLSSKKRVFGRRHQSYYETLSLLARICDLKGDTAEATGWRCFLPAGYIDRCAEPIAYLQLHSSTLDTLPLTPSDEQVIKSSGLAKEPRPPKSIVQGITEQAEITPFELSANQTASPISSPARERFSEVGNKLSIPAPAHKPPTENRKSDKEGLGKGSPPISPKFSPGKGCPGNECGGRLDTIGLRKLGCSRCHSEYCKDCLIPYEWIEMGPWWHQPHCPHRTEPFGTNEDSQTASDNKLHPNVVDHVGTQSNTNPAQPASTFTDAQSKPCAASETAQIMRPNESPKPGNHPTERVRAMFAFEPVQPGDLGFKKGDIITVLTRTEGTGWWMGRIGSQKGVFPSNFVEPEKQSEGEELDDSLLTPQRGKGPKHGGSAFTIDTATSSSQVESLPQKTQSPDCEHQLDTFPGLPVLEIDDIEMQYHTCDWIFWNEWKLPDVVMGIQFGLLESAASFIYREDQPFYTLHSWPGSTDYIRTKVPTRIRYIRNNTVNAWGHDVPDSTFYSLKQHMITLAESYKDPRKSTSSLATRESLTQISKESSIIIDYARKLRESIILQLDAAGIFPLGEDRGDSLGWCVAVPSIFFFHNAQSALVEILHTAGFSGSGVLISESCAALIFAIKQGSVGGASFSSAIVMNCEDTAIDLSLYQVTLNGAASTSPLAVKTRVLYKKGCGDIEQEFTNLVESRLRKLQPRRYRFRAKCLEEFKSSIKYNFTGSGQSWAVQLDTDLEDPDAGIQDGHMVFSDKELLACFEPTVNRILALLWKLMDQVPRTKLQFLVLTGAYSSSNFLINQLHKKLSPLKIRVICLDDYSYSPIKGAATAGLYFQRSALQTLSKSPSPSRPVVCIKSRSSYLPKFPAQMGFTANCVMELLDPLSEERVRAVRLHGELGTISLTRFDSLLIKILYYIQTNVAVDSPKHNELILPRGKVVGVVGDLTAPTRDYWICTLGGKIGLVSKRNARVLTESEVHNFVLTLIRDPEWDFL